jgi:hypothetical protein
MPNPRFKPPPGSRFCLGWDQTAEKTAFEIWVPDGKGNSSLLGPDGKRGKMGRGSCRVSEEKFWAEYEIKEVSDAAAKERDPL